MILATVDSSTVEWIDLIMGPLGALGIALLMLAVVAYSIRKIIIWGSEEVPKRADRFIKSIDKISSSHDRDREMFREFITKQTNNHKEVVGEIGDLKKDVVEIKSVIFNKKLGEGKHEIISKH